MLDTRPETRDFRDMCTAPFVRGFPLFQVISRETQKVRLDTLCFKVKN